MRPGFIFTGLKLSLRAKPVPSGSSNFIPGGCFTSPFFTSEFFMRGRASPKFQPVDWIGEMDSLFSCGFIFGAGKRARLPNLLWQID